MSFSYVAASLRKERALTACGLAHAALAVGCLAWLVLAPDSPPILGMHPALKPLKFGLSIGAYAFTVALLLPVLPLATSAKRNITRVVVGTMVIEMAIILAQALRQTTSHYNISSWTDAILWIAMGLGVLVNTMMMAMLSVIVLRRSFPGVPPEVGLGVRAGFFAFLFAAVSGFTMASRGAHSVGGADGGAGLPLTGWSVTHGDLRVSHFLALHALQVLPLVGLAFARSGGWAKAPSEAEEIVAGAGARKPGAGGGRPRRERGSHPAYVAFVFLYAIVTVAAFVLALLGLPLGASIASGSQGSPTSEALVAAVTTGLAPETIARVFSLSSWLVMPFWLLMVFAPRARVTQRVMATPWSVALPATAYAILILPHLGAVLPALARPELQVIAALLGTPEGALVAWLHFLAFDLYVGRRSLLSLQGGKTPSPVISLVMLATLLVGPVGFLCYLAARKTWGSRTTERIGAPPRG